MIIYEPWKLQWWVSCETAFEILTRIIKKPPDSKTIEDLHQRLKLKNEKEAHEKLTPSCAQHIVSSSDVISLTGIHKTGQESRDDFLLNSRSVRGSDFDYKKLMYSQKHRLPKRFGKILRSQRDWLLSLMKAWKDQLLRGLVFASTILTACNTVKWIHYLGYNAGPSSFELAYNNIKV